MSRAVRTPGRGLWRSQAGLTMIELSVVLAIVGALLLIVAPSFREFIAAQRVRGANGELVADLQYARSEAVRRNRFVVVAFDNSDAGSCYTVYLRGVSGDCSCTRGAGLACRRGPTELKTVLLPAGDGLRFAASSSDEFPEVFFEPPQGLPNRAWFTVNVQSSTHGKLRTTMNNVGRVTVCTPDNSIGGVSAC